MTTRTSSVLHHVPMHRIRRTLPSFALEDPEETTFRQTRCLLDEHGALAGARVAITAGSRGIHGIPQLLRGVVRAVRDAGGSPFLFSAMGSHGGGTAQGQRDILTSLGITEEATGAPISCSDEVAHLGETTGPRAGLPVRFAREAAEADMIIPVNRIKPHTSFHGPHESGLLKMLTVGAGRAHGASMVHRLGWHHMVEAIDSIATTVLDRLPVVGGIAIVQDAHEHPAVIEAIPAAELRHHEERLLDRARRLLPRLPVDRLDALIVRSMGKAYSGSGMDTNVIGRLRLEGMDEPAVPAIRALGVLDLDAGSHGNATGVGLADFTTERLVAKLDRESTYLNCLTSGGPQRAAVPMTFPSDSALVAAMARMLKPQPGEENTIRMAMIDNTLHLETLWISTALLPEIRDREEITILESTPGLRFDAAGAVAA
ncbi:DUF362 domain-containing protein [Spiractinospora alimapuensis]|uniref:DUF362 domain-containing protein n=1 Tax=Spiractinospora alimapuensis TaxID=2820884 RepID=UPI001F44C23A|nr:DUF362 domain-containing protein [Spiractinospora alimapuensis]QVQ52648.1 DUF362 domain-containing protein [Spiractinospora alimapuensis]